jgi:amino acid transporter
LLGIEANKEAVTAFSSAVVLILLLASSIGLWEGFSPGGTAPDAWPSSLEKTPDFVQSILYFYFVLAGFDLLMKFVQESKNPDKDIPKSFYVSNGVSTLLTAGVAYAFVHALTLQKGKSVPTDNSIGLIFDSFFGPPFGSVVHWISIGLMLATAFVTFLGTSRYLYGIGEDYVKGNYKELALDGVGEWLTRLNGAKVPINAILLVTGLAALGIMVNHTPHLVRLSDFFLTLVMFTVSAAVTKKRLGAGEVPLIEGATMLGFFALLMTCCF